MENNSEQSSMNAGESAGYPTWPQHLLEKMEEQLEMFWAYQQREMEHVNDFKHNVLPPTRIKKIMKADQDVHMVSTESPILLAKACEFFILDLTLRSWLNAEENMRRTLKKDDLTTAIIQTDIFDFLLDVVPGNDATGGSIPSVVPFYAAGGTNGQDNLDRQM
ncbi:nuclear transcription factor Y subunit C-1-like [Solanum dulcamara]|uniref:nuclear transcription factor Y subunit C-1-like n=1 Tax=Solanum dulcamara TaxID=45834 RepID=UPI002485671E|nr:nuclear transcription factor Y subunit C-1-like [Solanum dulcamara]